MERLLPPKQIVLHLRWQGGACEDIPITLPPKCCDQLRYPSEIVKKVRKLATSLTDEQIASAFNKEGLKSAKGKPFTFAMIRWIRYKHHIPGPNLKRPEELTVKQITRKLGVSPYVVYYWIERKVITARRANRGSPYWITMDSKKQKELVEWVRDSAKIKGLCAQHP